MHGYTGRTKASRCRPATHVLALHPLTDHCSRLPLGNQRQQPVELPQAPGPPVMAIRRPRYPLPPPPPPTPPTAPPKVHRVLSCGGPRGRGAQSAHSAGGTTGHANVQHLASGLVLQLPASDVAVHPPNFAVLGMTECGASASAGGGVDATGAVRCCAEHKWFTLTHKTAPPPPPPSLPRFAHAFFMRHFAWSLPPNSFGSYVLLSGGHLGALGGWRC